MKEIAQDTKNWEILLFLIFRLQVSNNRFITGTLKRRGEGREVKSGMEWWRGRNLES